MWGERERRNERRRGKLGIIKRKRQKEKEWERWGKGEDENWDLLKF